MPDYSTGARAIADDSEPLTHSTGLPTPRALHVRVVAHTHWDREWYHGAARFQARLVALVDALLAAPVDAARPFLLDGQTIVLDDYLQLRPERQTDIRRALASGALEAGPWYVLADNLIPSGEAIVRNLEAGQRWLARAGVAGPRVAYCPDTFGHPAALPQIAAGFGCETAVVWRGFGGASFPAADTVWWESSDGSRLLTYHLPPDGYEFGSALPTVQEDVERRWRRIESVLSDRNTTGVALLTVGADHHALLPQLDESLALLGQAAAAGRARITRGTLAAAMGEIRQAAADAATRNQSLPVVRGELRDSYGCTWTLQGTLATRADRKRKNARLERTMVHDVEPWGALAWLHGLPSARVVSPEGSLSLEQLPLLTANTWELLLRTHPHDTLCGCSLDSVARAMADAQESVAAMTVELRESALGVALQHDVVRARARDINPQPPTVVRNRLARPRSGLAEITLCDTLAHVPVGPGSALLPAVVNPQQPATPLATPLASALLNAAVIQPLSERVGHARRESPQHYPDNDLVRVRRVLAWVDDVPACGVRVFGTHEASAAKAPNAVLARHDEHGVELDNGLVRVIASPSGVRVIVGDRLLNDVLSLETIVDAGDSYTPSLRGHSERLVITAVRVGLKGPLRASARVFWRWRRGRESIRACTTLILEAGSATVRCDVRGLNTRKDHRLQLIWHTDVDGAQVVADAAFGPVNRVPVHAPANGMPYETPPATMPLHRWVAHANTVRGAALLSDGLAEGECTGSRLAVTLLRAIGELSRRDLPERPGHAGWPCVIPEAQCQGQFTARLALLLHGPLSPDTCLAIDEAADAFLLPLVGKSWRDLEGSARVIAGPRLDGKGLFASAIHAVHDGSAIRLRALNRRAVQGRGRWELPHGEWEYRPCRLDGQPLQPWAATSSVIEFDIGARALVTIEVRRAPTASTDRR